MKTEKELKQEINDLKQIVFKLQSDVEFARWENDERDIAFLKEMQAHAIDNRDITSHEMLLKMIADWIYELQNKTK